MTYGPRSAHDFGSCAEPPTCPASISPIGIAITGGRDNLEEAVTMRMARKRVLQRGGHRFHILVGEAGYAAPSATARS
jgi:hypothetical protein